MEVVENKTRTLTEEDLKRKVEERVAVPMTREKQEYIKSLMFKALEDPRAKYRPLSTDQMEKEWINPYNDIENLKIGC